MIYLFCEDDRINEEDLKTAFSEMDTQRQRSIQRIKDAHRRKQGIIAYKLLCYGAKEEYGINRLSSFRIGKYGKPSVDMGFYFNISHCDGREICAVSQRPVGIDVERKTPEIKEAADFFLTSYEKKMLAGKKDEYPMLWTLKEAFGKYYGVGLGYDLERTELLDFCNTEKTQDILHIKSWQEREYAYACCGEEKFDMRIISAKQLFQKE